MVKKEITNAYTAIVQDLNRKSSKSKKEALMKYFKTGKGEYGEGDVFIGVTIPDQRKIATKYLDKISEEEVKKLLKSDIHEHRSIALMILTEWFMGAQKVDNELKMKHIFSLYTSSFTYINNWDLVDSSARDIAGAFCYAEHSDRGKKYFTELTKSLSLWKKRVAVISTHYHIKKGLHDIALYIINKLMNDPHDLIHKACGWTLREVGKVSKDKLVGFLDKYSNKMPRTMLRYALEHFDPKTRTHYMKTRV